MIDAHVTADIKYLDNEKHHMNTLGDDSKLTTSGVQHQVHIEPQNTKEPKEWGDDMTNVVVEHTKCFKFDDKARSMPSDRISCDKEERALVLRT